MQSINGNCRFDRVSIARLQLSSWPSEGSLVEKLFWLLRTVVRRDRRYFDGDPSAVYWCEVRELGQRSEVAVQDKDRVEHLPASEPTPFQGVGTWPIDASDKAQAWSGVFPRFERPIVSPCRGGMGSVRRRWSG